MFKTKLLADCKDELHFKINRTSLQVSATLDKTTRTKNKLTETFNQILFSDCWLKKTLKL